VGAQVVASSTWGDRPTNLGGVVGGSKDEFRSAVVSRADVRDIRLILNEDLGASEITKLQDTTVGVEKKVLGLDIAMADSLRVDVGEGAEKLVNVELHFECGHGRLHLVEESRSAIDGLRNKLLHQVQVDFILLESYVSLGSIVMTTNECEHTLSPLE
jgi:hypothetical protein